jgi:cell division cycle 20, cofactor of APC complex
MIKSKLSVIQEQDLYFACENEDMKMQSYLSPPPKNKFDCSDKKQKLRTSAVGWVAFKLNIDGSPYGDRYIPKRREQESNIAVYEINHTDSPPIQINKEEFENSIEYEERKKAHNDKVIYNEMLKETFWGYPSPSKEADENWCHSNILLSPQKAAKQEKKAFKSKFLKFNLKKSNKENIKRAVRANHLKFNDFKIRGLGIKNIEKVTRIQAEKVLDAPNMVDDFYLNLLDWSSQNILAIALNQTAYLMDVSNKNISCIQPKSSDWLITSLSWMNHNKSYIAIGMENGAVEVWDTEVRKFVRELGGHTSRVSSLSWNKNMISTGSLDSSIINHDIRWRDHIVSRFEDHSKEVWGLKWSFDGSQLASGSNDNTLWIWDANMNNRPKFMLMQHKAAVKALAWCPLETNLLASGGGTKDKSIKFWNTDTGTELCGLKTSAQICSLIWSKNSKEIVSSHGYEKNELFVWKYMPNKSDSPIVKTAELCGHESRVLHLALSPNGTTVASTAPDETLRFWKVFQSDEEMSMYNPFKSGNSLFRGLIR